MKKVQNIILSAIAVGMLTACGDATATISDEPVATAEVGLQAEEMGAVEPFSATDRTEEVTKVSEKEDAEEVTMMPETIVSEPPEISLVMVGDILLHSKLQMTVVREDGTYHYDRIFEDMKPEITEADLALVNQEVIIGGAELGVSGYPCFNAPYEIGDALVESGFDVICHATNHALDKGKKGLLNCVQFWKEEYPQIATIGIYETEEESEQIYTYEQDGITIAVLNYTYGTNGIALPKDMPFAVNLLEEEKVIADIQKAEEIADFTIVCPHWGTEYVLEQTAAQEKWAKLFLEHGVDLVIGTHPHVIEPIEMLEDEETGHKMLVYYSIGNFVNWTSESGAGKANRMVGGMAKVTIGLDENEEAVITDYGVTALVTHLKQETEGVYTTRLSDYTQELSLVSDMIKQDAAFSKEYCVELCDKVWGDLWE